MIPAAALGLDAVLPDGNFHALVEPEPSNGYVGALVWIPIASALPSKKKACVCAADSILKSTLFAEASLNVTALAKLAPPVMLAFKSAYESIVTLPAVVPSSPDVTAAANSSADSSQINDTFAAEPLFMNKPWSKVFASPPELFFAN